MVSDSPYEFREPILGAVQGAIAGLVGAAGMLGLLKVLESVSGLQLSLLLMKLGLVVLPGCRQTCGAPFLILAGLGVHSLVGVVCGSLHALSQQRVPVRGLVTVGIFYGFLVWIVSGLLADVPSLTVGRTETH